MLPRTKTHLLVLGIAALMAIPAVATIARACSSRTPDSCAQTLRCIVKVSPPDLGSDTQPYFCTAPPTSGGDGTWTYNCCYNCSPTQGYECTADSPPIAAPNNKKNTITYRYGSTTSPGYPIGLHASYPTDDTLHASER